ncbi:MAG: 5-oxoprolinase [Dehalococcoidia bacterium]|nr:MAG: 5-oxoprolinase [Dehalococcoidia bacterium]
MTRYRVGVDTGGTFTDLLAIGDDGSELVVKVPSTPSEPARSLLNALQTLAETHGVDLGAIDLVLHGTTVGINALLQRRYPPAGLITTEGFRDILEIARQTIPGERGAIYVWVKPPRIVPVSRVREVGGRLDARGNEIRPLDEAALRSHAREYRAMGIKHIAVSFINSYVNPVHERRAREVLLDEYPECSVVISTDTLPEFREYERTVATVMNTILTPVVAEYVRAIQRGLQEHGVRAPLLIMKSSGGVTTGERAAVSPVQTALSGPVAAVLGLAWVGAQAGREDVITFDMGGTSTDVALVEGSQPAVVQEAMIDVYPLRVPTLDVVSVGAGGGSIARTGPGGSVRVGPESAGAIPGPACYGAGGEEATITDANVFLGRLGTRLAGGTVKLDPERAAAVVRRFADQLGVSPERAAAGILEIANFNMADAIRQVSIARGRDPRRFALIAGGGAGPLHAARLAELLEIPEVIIPLTPGVGCAVGLLASDVQEDLAVTEIQREEAADLAALSAKFERLEREVHHRLVAQGFAAEEIELRRSADLRYRGQRTELTVAVPGGTIDEAAFREMVHRFHEAYKSSFDYNYEGEQTTELVTLRVTGVVRLPHSLPAAPSSSGALPEARPVAARQVYFDGDGWVTASIYERDGLVAGASFDGPAIVEQYDTTTLVPPRHHAVVHPSGSLIITRTGELV